MKVQLVGCSHHRSSTVVRERLAFSAEQAGVALDEFRVRFPSTEAVLLSTCNRVEVYTATEDAGGGPSHEEVATFLAEFHGLRVTEVFDDLFERSGEDAVRHLFMVAASVDSMVVGEPQIVSQVKQSYDLATRRNSTGPLTNQIFQAAIKVAKRVSTETRIHEKRVSIPSVAIGFARGVFERFDDKKVVILGAGEMADETLRYLHDEGARDLVVLNRSLARAQELAEHWNGVSLPWERLADALTAADLVVSTTGASEHIVTLETFRHIEAARYQRDLFVLDLAIPRDFDPAIAAFGKNLYLYTLDDLRGVCEENLRQRAGERDAAMLIVEQETRRFMADLHHRATGPIIKRLRHGWQQVQEDELRRLFNKMPELDDSARDEIRASFDRLINKLLHPPLESLRDESKHGIPHALLDAFKRLFQIKD